MVDRIAPLEATVQRLARQPRSGAAALAYTIGTASSTGPTSWASGAPPGRQTDQDDDQAANSGLSFADEAQAARDAAHSLVERARSLAEVRRGRLTAAKREQLTACRRGFQAADQALADLLTATDQHTAALAREHMRFLAGHHSQGGRP